MKAVGIDVGSFSIKVVEAQNNAKSLAITRFTEFPLGQNPTVDPRLEIIETLRQLVSSYDQANTRIVLGLRQDKVSVRHKFFPFNERQKILKSLPFELEEDLPFSSDNAVFDAKIIHYIGATSEILACAAPKTRVGEALDFMDDIGVEAQLLSAEGLAFANTVENWNDPIPIKSAPTVTLEETGRAQRHVQILLQIGHTRTLVCAFEGRSLIGLRTVLWGGKNIADAISRKYEIPYIEALKEMQTKAFVLLNKEGASYDQIVFSDVISAQLREFSRELRISLLEFQAEFNGVLDSVKLSGGTSQILNIHAFLTQELEVTVNKLDTLQYFPQVQFDRTDKIKATMGVALGLAIEGLKKPRNPALNFLKGEFAKQNQILQMFWNRWGPTLQVAASAFLIFLVYAFVRESFSLSLSDKATEALKTQARTAAKLSARMANEAGVKKFIREEKRKALELKTFTTLTQMNSALDILKKINDAAPGKVAVTLNVQKILVQERQVQIEGTVKDNRELSILQQSLRALALGGKITSAPATVQPIPGATPFAYSFMVDRGVK